MHPHHKLNNIPYDIFITIVLFCWDNSAECDKSSHFPTTASHVCSTWRRYALDTPTFWSSLSFHQTDLRRALLRCEAWLERTRPDSLLDIVLGPEPFGAASVKRVKSIMRMIVPHVGRWRSLRVEKDVPRKIMRIVFDRLRNVDAPMLEVLKVAVESAQSTRLLCPTDRWKLDPFVRGTASRLAELDVDGFVPLRLVERFKTLRHLRLAHPDLEVNGQRANLELVHRILSLLPELRSLVMDCVGYVPSVAATVLMPGTDAPPLPRVTHPALSAISIHLPIADTMNILASLDLPSVQYFLKPHRLELELTLQLALLPIVTRHRPFPNLVSLCLGGSLATAGVLSNPQDPMNKTWLKGLEEALDGMPLLQALTFDGVDLDGGEALLCLSRTCPRLRWLKLYLCRECTLEPLRAVVEARSNHAEMDDLEHLVIQNWFYVSDRFVIIDEETDRWLKASSVDYRVLDDCHFLSSDRRSYLVVAEGLDHARPLTQSSTKWIQSV